jgi:hypothetical protein
MRRVFGLILIGLGVLCLVFAPMIKFYAVPKLAVAPLDLDPAKPSTNSGVATKLLDLATLTERSNVPLTSIRYTRSDIAATQQAGGNNAVYDSFSRVNDDKGQLVTASTERYAFDRTTDILITGYGSNVDGKALTDENIAGDAIMPLKLPFFLDKSKTYNFYDTSLAKGFPVTFTDEEQLDGLTVYKYEATIPATQIGEQEGVAALVGSTDPNYKAGRFYANHRVLYAEPLTGQIVDGSEDQLQTLRGPDGTDKITIIQGKLGFTPEYKAQSIAEAKTNSAKLSMLSSTVPMIALIVGILALLGGILLLRRPSDDSDAPAHVSTTKAEPAVNS